jgi:sulfotransferase
MEKKVYFVSGLPRSGSTLFVNILNQNPNFHATGSSGLIDVIKNVRDTFEVNPFFKAMTEEENMERRKGAIQGVIQGYFAGTDKPICFDKNRLWPGMMEMLCFLYGKENVKVICCMRDIRDILASFEVLHRKTAHGGSTSQERGNPLLNSTSLGRAVFLMENSEVVGFAKNCLLDAIQRGFSDQMFCLDYDYLTNKPEECMKKVYNFIDQEYYEHDFDNVEAVTIEDDRVHGFKDLHKIRSKVEPQEPKWPIVYDSMTLTAPWWKELEKSCQFWRTPNQQK